MNELDCRPPIDYISIEGTTTTKMKVTVRPSYADNPLIVGPRYQEQDFNCRWALPLGINTSGVFCENRLIYHVIESVLLHYLIS